MPQWGLKFRCANCHEHAKPPYSLHDGSVVLCRSCFFQIREIEEHRGKRLGPKQVERAAEYRNKRR